MTSPKLHCSSCANPSSPKEFEILEGRNEAPLSVDSGSTRVPGR